MTENWKSALKSALHLTQQNQLLRHENYSKDAAKLFKPVITNTVMGNIDWNNPQDPMLLQFLPHKDELKTPTDYLTDPVGDHPSSPVAGLIHKYHGRVLLIASGSCAVNCRYCFRRHYPYTKSFAPRNKWQAALEYIKNNTSIHEVILSGGDPLTLDTKTLQQLTQSLNTIDHIKTLRIHSRIPTVLPSRIDKAFLHWSNSINLNKVMVLHINHASEIDTTSSQAIKRLKQANFTLLNQSVVLKDINDHADILTDLSHQLFKHGVMPYYLHVFDKVQNASHFDTSNDSINQLYQQLQKNLPGYLLPKLVQEEAGKASKTLVTPFATS